MARLYGREYTRSEILKRVGNMSSICGVKRAVLAEGREQGVESLFFKTGSGFNFTVLPGRGMDISSADYQGVSLCWRSAVGEVGPAYFEREGFGWLRSFFGGLLTTCGLTDVGDPCVDPDLSSEVWRSAMEQAAAGQHDRAIAEIRQALLVDQGSTTGIHGRVSNIPAEQVSVTCDWEADEYVMSAGGTVREASSFGEDISLRRTVSARLGENRLRIHDVVANEGYEVTPHMILYHINVGFPILGEDSRLILPGREVIPRDAEAEREKERYDRFGPPVAGFQEQVFYHELLADQDGATCAAVVNESLCGGVGLYVKFNRNQLPRFVEWKMLGERTYVVGLEPANCWVDGRARERESGTLAFLEAGERREYDLEIGVLTGDNIADLENAAKGMIRGAR